MTPPNILWINGVDISTLDLGVVDLPEWWSGVTYERASAPVHGLLGSVPAISATVPPSKRNLELLLVVDVLAERAEKFDAVKALCRGLCEFRVGDAERVRFGRVESVQARLVRKRMSPDKPGEYGDLLITLGVVFYDPLMYDLLASELAFTDTPVEVALGTAPSVGVILLTGPATDPELVYRDSGGVAREGMVLESLASGAAYEIDLANSRLTKVVAGVRTAGLPFLVSGWFFALDPEDEPTLEVSDGEAVLYYRRAYL